MSVRLCHLLGGLSFHHAPMQTHFLDSEHSMEVSLKHLTISILSLRDDKGYLAFTTFCTFLLGVGISLEGGNERVVRCNTSLSLLYSCEKRVFFSFYMCGS